LCRQAFLIAARLGDQRTSAMAADIVEGGSQERPAVMNRRAAQPDYKVPPRVQI
jgi:hypothetical protein